MAFPPVPRLGGRAWRTGTAASVLSAAVLAWRGHRETRRAAVPVDAISRWVHGAKAYRRRELDVPRTALGYAIHHASSVFWGALYALRLGPCPGANRVVGAAVAVGALAA